MAEAVKNKVDTSLKDKLKVTHGLMLLLGALAGQVDFSTIQSVPITKVFIIAFVGCLTLGSLIEDHRHKEATGNYPKAVEVLDQQEKMIRKHRMWIKKQLKAIEDSSMPEEKKERLKKEGKEVMKYG